MGIVYEATQISLNRKVALKIVAAHLSEDPAFRERFRREGQLQAAIDHPHIITVYEAGESDEGLFLAMRLVDGPTLKELIIQREVSPARALQLLDPVAKALDTAHRAGLIHRDVKPHNILITKSDHAFLADFGLTKASAGQSLTKTGQFVGTLDYVSPEQIQDEPASPASDIYSLGAVLYEALVGSVPFSKQTDAAVLYAHLSEDPPLASEERTDLPTDIDAVILRAMAKKPQDRYEAATQLLEEAWRAFSRPTSIPTTAPGPAVIPGRTPRPQGTQAGNGAGTVAEPPAPEVAEAEEEPEAEREQPEEPEEDATGEVAAADEPAAPSRTVVPEPAGETQIAPEPADETQIAAEPAEEAQVAGEPDAETEEPAGDEPAPGAIAPAADAERTKAAPEPAASAVTAQEAEATAPRRASAEETPSSEASTRTVDGGLLADVRAAVRRGTESTGGRVAAVALGALVIAGLGYLGYELGSSDSSSAQDFAPTSSASASSTEISFPDDWQRDDQPPAIPGMRFEDPMGVSPVADDSSGLLTGMVKALGPRLLPEPFVKRLEAAPPEGEPVTLGDYEALRYEGLQLRGEERLLNVYAIPTGQGVATFACFAGGPATDAFFEECESVADTVTLSGVKVFALAPSASYADVLNDQLDELASATAKGTAALEDAKTPGAQAKAADELAAAYGRAGDRLAKEEVSPAAEPATDRVVKSMSSLQRAYAELATAVRKGDESGYREAGKAIGRGGDSLTRALDGLAAVGFELDQANDAGRATE
jgi:Protein kinase domain